MCVIHITEIFLKYLIFNQSSNKIKHLNFNIRLLISNISQNLSKAVFEMYIPKWRISLIGKNEVGIFIKQ